jgi:hypothetical protein
MIDAFALLDLPRSLTLEEKKLREAYRIACKNRADDLLEIGSADTTLSEAYRLLQSPARRLRHWLELSGIGGETRGVVDGELLNWFTAVGSTIQQADRVLRKYEQCQSQLARAMMAAEMQQGQKSVEQQQQALAELTRQKTAVFPLLEAGAFDHEAAWICVRDLAFIEKWQQQLRERYGRFFV